MKRRKSFVILFGLAVTILAVVGLVYFFGSTAQTNSPTKVTMTPEQKAKENERKTNQIIADKVINNLLYIKHSRTGLCYAYYWNGSFRNSGTLALIPESAIPPGMLIVVNVDDKK